MPKRRLAWASWNYLTKISPKSSETQSQTMCLTYWMNRLQPFVDVETYGEVFVTMNPLDMPEKSKILKEFRYTHPLYSPETIAAQDVLNSIQNKVNTTFAGAWTNYGFHGNVSGYKRKKKRKLHN
jgi:predicted NAD/FAD-binding protein